VFLKQLEQGVAPWRKPWSRYRGLNVFLLATHGYGSPYWLTFNQASQLGAHVRQGEKSTLVSFWKFSEYAKENRETGQTENKTSVLLRYYRVSISNNAWDLGLTSELVVCGVFLEAITAKRASRRDGRQRCSGKLLAFRRHLFTNSAKLSAIVD